MARKINTAKELAAITTLMGKLSERVAKLTTAAATVAAPAKTGRGKKAEAEAPKAARRKRVTIEEIPAKKSTRGAKKIEAETPKATTRKKATGKKSEAIEAKISVRGTKKGAKISTKAVAKSEKKVEKKSGKKAEVVVAKKSGKTAGKKRGAGFNV